MEPMYSTTAEAKIHLTELDKAEPNDEYVSESDVAFNTSSQYETPINSLSHMLLYQQAKLTDTVHYTEQTHEKQKLEIKERNYKRLKTRAVDFIKNVAKTDSAPHNFSIVDGSIRMNASKGLNTQVIGLVGNIEFKTITHNMNSKSYVIKTESHILKEFPEFQGTRLQEEIKEYVDYGVINNYFNKNLIIHKGSDNSASKSDDRLVSVFSKFIGKLGNSELEDAICMYIKMGSTWRLCQIVQASNQSESLIFFDKRFYVYTEESGWVIMTKEEFTNNILTNIFSNITEKLFELSGDFSPFEKNLVRKGCSLIDSKFMHASVPNYITEKLLRKLFGELQREANSKLFVFKYKVYDNEVKKVRPQNQSDFIITKDFSITKNTGRAN